MLTPLFNAEIFVDDIPAQEYSTEFHGNNDACFVECHIKAEEGKRYAVSIATISYDALVSVW